MTIGRVVGRNAGRYRRGVTPTKTERISTEHGDWSGSSFTAGHPSTDGMPPTSNEPSVDRPYNPRYDLIQHLIERRRRLEPEDLLSLGD